MSASSLTSKTAAAATAYEDRRTDGPVGRGMAREQEEYAVVPCRCHPIPKMRQTTLGKRFLDFIEI